MSADSEPDSTSHRETSDTNNENDDAVSASDGHFHSVSSQSQFLFASVLDAASHISIIATDSEGLITTFNSGAERMLGYAADEMIGKQTPQLIHLESEIMERGRELSKMNGEVVQGFNVFINTARDGKLDQREWTYVRKDGSHLTVTLTVTAVRDPEQKIIGYLGVAQDITERKLAERETRRLSERLGLAMRASNTGLWDWHIETGEMYFSDTWFTMLGYEPGELKMDVDSWKQIAHPDELQSALNALDRHFKRIDPVYICEHRVQRKDGAWQWVRDVGEVVEWTSEGEPKRMVGVHVDIDDSKRFAYSLEALTEISAAANEHQTLRELTRVIAESFGVQFVGVARTFNDEDASRRARMVGGIFCGEAIEPFEYSLVGTPCAKVDTESFCYCPASVTEEYPDDQILVDMGAQSYAGVRLHNSKGDEIGILMVVHSDGLPRSLSNEANLRVFGARAADILERTDIETGLKEARDAAELASRAKSEFLANMSHEIRTPMTAILGYADLLVGDGEFKNDQENATEAVRTIQSNASHLLAIINDILDVSKIEAGQMKIEVIDTNPMQIVEEVASLVGRRASGKGVDFQVRFDSPIPQCIQSDPTRLRQILLNLAGNAIKFTEVGSITISAECDAENQAMRFRVIDTGVGMTPEQRSEVAQFKPFTQADSSTTRKFGGSGLGLRISNALAIMLGGGIEVDAQPGEGSTFTATIATGELHGVPTATPPRRDSSKQANASSDPLANSAASTRSRPLDGLVVLVAEDGPDNQRLISFHLTRAGAKAILCENGLVAAERIESSSLGDMPHLILMDMQMPELDGYGATRRLRDAGCDLPIIALTAHAMDGDRQKCLDAGCSDYLTKPIDATKLIEVCSKWGHAQPAGSKFNATSR